MADAASVARAPSIARGFADPVLGSQVGFRCALDALADPGSTRTVDVGLPDIGLPSAALALLLALVDNDTPLWTSPSVTESVRAYLRFHVGARFAPTHSACAFAYVANLAELPEIGSFSGGSAMSPEDSTTVVIAVDSLVGGTAATLDGPGCKAPRVLAPAGFTASLWAQLAANHHRFPMGVDVLLASGSFLVGLPRSTQVLLIADDQED